MLITKMYLQQKKEARGLSGRTKDKTLTMRGCEAVTNQASFTTEPLVDVGTRVALKVDTILDVNRAPRHIGPFVKAI